MKKVKKMAIGGIGAALGAATAKAVAAKKPMGLGEGIARAAGVPVGSTVNAPARIMPIGGMRPPGQGTTGGPLVKPLPPGVKLSPDSGMGSAMQANPRIPAGVQNAISNLKAGNIPKARPGSMVGQRFGGMGMKKGGKVSSASKRADGCAVKGKTKGRMV
jgi:hypothetical protein